MKKILSILHLAACMVAVQGVCGADVNSPASTIASEKHHIVKACGDSNGADYLIIPVKLDYVCLNEDMLSLAKIHWCVDEYYYLNGYKAKLSDAIDEISAPPDKEKQLYRTARDGFSSC